MTTNFETEIQKLAPSARIELFEVDMTALGDVVYYFHAGTNELQTPVIWQGNTYQPWPVQGSGFDYSSSGTLPRPKLTIANTAGTITAMVLAFNDCIGAKVTRRRTLARFLDAANFAAGNANADPNSHYADEIYFIDRKASESPDVVEFELTSATDAAGVMLPRRQIIQNLCPWRYRGSECGYTGTNYFLADDTTTPNAADDKCGKRVSSCKARFGDTAELSFGGFPAAGLVSG